MTDCLLNPAAGGILSAKTSGVEIGVRVGVGVGFEVGDGKDVGDGLGDGAGVKSGFCRAKNPPIATIISGITRAMLTMPLFTIYIMFSWVVDGI